jgi:hypothetical protein
MSRRHQGCPQSADCESSSPEEGCTTKEIRYAEVNVLSMCGRTAQGAKVVYVYRIVRNFHSRA